jgi:hypothetical protein
MVPTSRQKQAHSLIRGPQRIWQFPLDWILPDLQGIPRKYFRPSIQDTSPNSWWFSETANLTLV